MASYTRIIFVPITLTLFHGMMENVEHLNLPTSISFSLLLSSFSQNLHIKNRNACCNLITKEFHIVYNKFVYDVDNI